MVVVTGKRKRLGRSGIGLPRVIKEKMSDVYQEVE
jgi:hypothetical protein